MHAALYARNRITSPTLYHERMYKFEPPLKQPRPLAIRAARMADDSASIARLDSSSSIIQQLQFRRVGSNDSRNYSTSSSSMDPSESKLWDGMESIVSLTGADEGISKWMHSQVSSFNKLVAIYI